MFWFWGYLFPNRCGKAMAEITLLKHTHTHRDCLKDPPRMKLGVCFSNPQGNAAHTAKYSEHPQHLKTTKQVTFIISAILSWETLEPDIHVEAKWHKPSTQMPGLISKRKEQMHTWWLHMYSSHGPDAVTVEKTYNKLKKAVFSKLSVCCCVSAELFPARNVSSSLWDYIYRVLTESSALEQSRQVQNRLNRGACGEPHFAHLQPCRWPAQLASFFHAKVPNSVPEEEYGTWLHSVRESRCWIMARKALQQNIMMSQRSWPFRFKMSLPHHFIL